jgi:hypothetical protein
MLMNKTRFPLGSLIAAQPYESGSANNHVCRERAVVSLGGGESVVPMDFTHTGGKEGERRKAGRAFKLSHG